MANTAFSISFLPRKCRKNKKNELPLYIRVNVQGQIFEKSLGFYIAPELWDSKGGCVKGNSALAFEINEQIQFQRAKILRAKRLVEEEEIPLTIQTLKDKYKTNGEAKRYVLQLFDKHNEEMEAIIGKGSSAATVKRYKTVRKLLSEYIMKTYHRNDLLLHEITSEFIRGFEVHLKSVRKCNHNTTMKYIRNFQKLIKRATDNGWLKINPFRNMKFKLNEVQTVYLNNEELNALLEKKFDIDRLEQIRDIFLFCCFTGMAFVDVKNLNTSHICIDAEKAIYIQKYREKTDILCNIPILSITKTIIEKYAFHPCRLRENKILPVLSNQKYNDYLKEIATICGIQKRLTTHVARHTFATTVAINNEIPEHIVARILGHTNTKMTQHYAKLNIASISTAMKRIENIYSYKS
jgi:site-specific recombinase XerD